MCALIRRPTQFTLFNRRICKNFQASCRIRDLPPCRREFGSLAEAPFERIARCITVEEECLTSYKAEHYYPVRAGESLDGRYKVLGKLGYGTSSTVWLCRDLDLRNRYVAVKVFTIQPQVNRELPIYNYLKDLRSRHCSREHVRTLLDSFWNMGPHGVHLCLVHEPLGLTLAEVHEHMERRICVEIHKIQAEAIKKVFRMVLRGVSFLHEEAGIIHTDQHPYTIFIKAENECVFKNFETSEARFPAARKLLQDRTIYTSRSMGRFHLGHPTICDLSAAHFDHPSNRHTIMLQAYRAAEVILGLPWSFPVDIWAIGMMIWDLFEGELVFPATDPWSERYSAKHQLAHMVAFLGPPPRDMI